MLREVLTFIPGQPASFHKADYPWLTWIRVFAKGGDAGHTIDAAYPTGTLDERLTATVGVGAEDGYLIIELYDGQPDP